jgi:hypothetical protein
MVLVKNSNLVLEAKVFPPLQGDGHITVLPNVVVKCSQLKLLALNSPGVGQKLNDL